MSEELFEQVQAARKHHSCPASYKRSSIFQGLLFCDHCGGALSVAHRKLTYREDDLYRCIKHFNDPEACPKTHAIYHEALYQFVLNQIRGVAKSMKRRKINSPITAYAGIEELTPEILHTAISKIEIGHVTRKSRLTNVVKIHWILG